MQCVICGSDAWYVCGRSGRPVCPQHARIEVVSKLSFGSSDGLSVREATSADYATISQVPDYFRREGRACCLGKEYEIGKLPACVVGTNSHVTGVLYYAPEDDALVVVALDVLPGYQGLGAGSMLLDALKGMAAGEGKSTVLASASNDDLPAIYFYQKNGFRIYDVVQNAVAEQRGEVQVGFAGISSRDEICLRCDLQPE